MNSDSRLDALESRLGYVFGNRDLLRRALVHRSLVNESELDATDSNERLEFLGDAALELAATSYLFERYPDRLEGELSSARAALVNLRSLAKRAEGIELVEFISTGVGDILTGGRSRETVVGRTYEAIIGAIFVDGGLSRAEALLKPWFEEFFQDYDFGPDALDSKSRLQQVAQGEGGPHPTYRLIESSGPEHAKVFRVEVSNEGEVLAEGEGSSVQRAELDAAGRALEDLRRDRSAQTNQAAN
jgi:ribonuclease-3